MNCENDPLLFWLYHIMAIVIFLNYSVVRNILRHLQLLNLLASIHHVNRSLMEISSYFWFFQRFSLPYHNDVILYGCLQSWQI